MKKIIEFDEKCQGCNGTGLYVGFAERDGAAVVCNTCEGTGCFKFKHEYEEFTEREDLTGIKRVYQTNPGIYLGEREEYKLEDFGGLPFIAWKNGEPFTAGTENRKFTCPAWWYQSVNYGLKPNWKECIGIGPFSKCDNFQHKEKCWKKWDRIHLQQPPQQKEN